MRPSVDLQDFRITNQDIKRNHENREKEIQGLCWMPCFANHPMISCHEASTSLVVPAPDISKGVVQRHFVPMTLSEIKGHTHLFCVFITKNAVN